MENRYPRLEINLAHLQHNVSRIVEKCGSCGIQVAGVIKGATGHPEVAKAFDKGGAAFIASSRLEQIEDAINAGIEKPMMLIRVPMLSEVSDVVRLTDISLNSEFEVIKALNEESRRQGKLHKVILMADLGDLREGFWDKEEMVEIAEYIENRMINIQLVGIGTNLGCYGSIAPTAEKLEELVELAEAQEKFVWEIVQQADMIESERTAEQSFAKMHEMYRAMWQADQDYDGARRSASRRAGGDGEKLEQYNASGNNICGPFIGKVMEKAIKMGESNACMRRIVAAPTAGSCGVLPAVLLSFAEDFPATEEMLVQALYVAAGIGKVIAENASLAGASGGCQAEIGSASAMAAGALVCLQGGDAEAIMHGAALALKNMLGLV